ncbi:MAG: TonB-dependent receptor plug domain-containing protein [Methylobacter sp.]|nr:TonB-dependent receptor plug domain-containing protein [Methylobacter sp.]MDP2097727.1 TonB-dependent receptor plug domain-containing protein [Methylobacter sp.]MDP2427219.1 TonB-dependent receptor plug domain-containing protein [Methylobacter sp.]MDP3056706.1 TonB-dependent receptor plug domain-containing protein [Methylobacter sp.]MDP3363650.1 TonB-dependent receptor plug domain-containing protein [Methylobacter sp.]
MSKKNMTSKEINATTRTKWLVALLPMGAALNGIVLAADVDTDKKAEEGKVTLPIMEVKGSAGKQLSNYKVDTSTAGTKTDTPLIETPQSISVITNDQMEAQNVSTMAEALRYTPGVQSETFGFEPRTTFIRMRGFDATQTGLFRDGLKLANPGFAIDYSLEPYGAERVEVPRGPAFRALRTSQPRRLG